LDFAEALGVETSPALAWLGSLGIEVLFFAARESGAP
jgi:hypothetical protein